MALVIRAIFFDAAGTLFRLPKGVGFHYALVARRLGLAMNAEALDRAFAVSWQRMPSRPATGERRADDDKGWWRDLVFDVVAQVAPATGQLDRHRFFEAAYAHFAEANVWELYPETLEVLDALSERVPLAIVSNFDGRLRTILEHLGISRHFRDVFISSELGADKPDARIYQRALEITGNSAPETCHVGDDPERDWGGAAGAGLQVWKLERPKNSLLDFRREIESELAGRR